MMVENIKSQSVDPSDSSTEYSSLNDFSGTYSPIVSRSGANPRDGTYAAALPNEYQNADLETLYNTKKWNEKQNKNGKGGQVLW